MKSCRSLKKKKKNKKKQDPKYTFLIYLLINHRKMQVKVSSDVTGGIKSPR